MQYPVGMAFNPETVRNEMVDFAAVAGKSETGNINAYGRKQKEKIDKRCGAEAKIRPYRAPSCRTVELGRKRAFQHPVPEIRIERTLRIYQGDACRTRNQGG